LMLRFAWPFIISSVLVSLYGAVDLFVVGRYTNSAAISGVSSGTQIMNIVVATAIGLSTAGTVILGRCIGEKNEEAASRGVGTFLAFSIGVAFFMFAIVMLLQNQIIALMKVPPESVIYAKQYVFYCGFAVVPHIMYFSLGAIFRGMGNSMVPSILSAVSCGMNIVLDFVFVAGFGWGVIGAAVATAISQVMGFVVGLFIFLRIKLPFPLTKKDIRIDKESLRFIIKVGSPIGLQELLVNMSFMIITTIMNSMGVIVSASAGVVSRVFNTTLLIPTSFGAAVAAMTAQNLGAGKRDRALKSLRWGIIYPLIFAVIFCVYAQLWPGSLTGLFSKDPEVIANGAMYLRSYVLDSLLVSFVFVMNSYFSGSGKSLVSMIHSLVATFGVRIPFSYFLSRMEGVTMFQLGFSAPAASLLSLIVCFIYLFWQEKKYKEQNLVNATV